MNELLLNPVFDALCPGDKVLIFGAVKFFNETGAASFFACKSK
jgi:hypothetical protein